MKHSTPAPRRSAHRMPASRSSRVRSAVVGIGLLAIGGTAASALWTDTAAVQTTVTTGTLDIDVDKNQANPTPYVIDMALTNMAPGGTRSKEVTVNNNGTLPVILSMATTNTGGAQGLATAITGSVAIPDHAGSPAGPLLSQAFVDKRIEPGGSAKVTLTVSLPSALTNAWQGKTDTIKFNFTAVQAG